MKAEKNYTDGYFWGKIGDARMYGRELTPDDIKQLYFPYCLYYQSWWRRVLMMVKETWLILIGREVKGGFDFWWTSYNKAVYERKRR